MESEDIAWTDTRDGAANFNGKYNTIGDSVYYICTSHIDTLYLACYHVYIILLHCHWCSYGCNISLPKTTTSSVLMIWDLV